ncbi:MAG TPA: hypothetical protein DEB39_07340 [Planctomycetaceae bacterium]|nr:hypothetical protein [Planctomycetaceae bacterium]
MARNGAPFKTGARSGNGVPGVLWRWIFADYFCGALLRSIFDLVYNGPPRIVNSSRSIFPSIFPELFIPKPFTMYTANG